MSNPISERSTKLYQILKAQGSRKEKYRLFDVEPLLDAFYALYDILCTTDSQKKDKQVANFVKKFRNSIEEIRSYRPSKEDFEILKTIGRGHFGEVHVVRERNTSDIYAMKILKKASTLSNDNVAFYEEERDVMAFSNSPWVTSLQYAFQDPENLYLVMEFLPGGDLLNLLNRYDDSIMDENDARFYIAEIISAVHAVHIIGYVHRDIKPENILIDFTGHLKLADFGSAAKLINDSKVICKMPVGTPEYIAPEVLQSMNSGGGLYGVECDWWSVGVVCYEMLCGMVPFQADGILKLYSQIMNHKKSLTFPDDVTISAPAENLVIGLLEDQKNRYGYTHLAKHEFFSSLDWTTLLNTKPPFIPQVKDSTDTSHFENLTPTRISSPQPIQPTLSNTIPFIGFTFTRSISSGEKSTKVSVSRMSSMHRSPSNESNEKPSKLTQINEILNQNIDNLNIKLKELEANHSKLKNDYDLMVMENNLMNKTAAEIEQRVNRLTQERDQLQKALDKERVDLTSVNELRTNINVLNFELVTQGAKLEEALIERDGLKIKMSGYLSEIEMYQNKLTQYESKIKGMDKVLVQTSSEFKSSIEELQELLDRSTLKFQERLQQANQEARNYREKYEILEKKTNTFKKQESQELNNLNQQLLQSSEAQMKLNNQIMELRESLGNKENELKNNEILIMKLNQNIKSFENRVEQLQSKINELEASTESYDVETKNMRLSIEELLISKQLLVSLIEQKDKKIIELQNMNQQTENFLSEERKKSVDKTSVLQMNLNEMSREIQRKDSELAELKDILRRSDTQYKSTQQESTKAIGEIERLNAIITAQKASNFSLSQELEQANERIKALNMENEELNSNIISTNASTKAQLYKLEATIAQQTKLINFLHTDVPKKKGFRSSKADSFILPGVRYSKAVREGNERKDRDMEKLLEVERNQCLVLNSEINKLKEEIKKLKNSSTPRKQNSVEVTNHYTNGSEHSTIDSLNEVSSIGVVHEHILNPNICYRANVCFICLRPINYSHITLKCYNCKIFFHSSCQNYLPSFSCKVLPVLLNVEDLMDYSLLYQIYPDLDAAKHSLPFSGYLSILNIVGNNKFDWRKHMFELNLTSLTIKNDEDGSEETGMINFSEMKNFCLIRSAVHTCDILFTPPTKVPFVFAIEINNVDVHNFNLYSNDSSNKETNLISPSAPNFRSPSSTPVDQSNAPPITPEYSILYLMAQTLDEKRLWVRLLNNVINNNCHQTKDYPIQNPIFSIDSQLFSNITCIHQISDDIILFGYSQGLACIRLSDKTIQQCLEPKIECHTLYKVGNQIFGLFDKNRQLHKLLVDKKTKSIIHVPSKNKMRIYTQHVENFQDCFDIHYGELKHDNIFLYFSKFTELYCVKMGSDGHYISHTKISTGDVVISSLIAFDQMVITCQEKFYMYNFATQTQKEFLNAEDHSLAFIIYGSHAESNYPMSIFLTNRTDTPEFLICCSEFGVIVDKDGRRLSGGDLRWDQIPLSFHYYGKTLVISYPNMIEVRNFDIGSINNLSEFSTSIYININCPMILTHSNINLNEIIVCNVNINDYMVHLMKLSLTKTVGISGVSLSRNKSMGVTLSKTMSKKSIDASSRSTKRQNFLSRMIK